VGKRRERSIHSNLEFSTMADEISPASKDPTRIQFRDVESNVNTRHGFPLQRQYTDMSIRSANSGLSRERPLGAQVAVEYRALY